MTRSFGRQLGAFLVALLMVTSVVAVSGVTASSPRDTADGPVVSPNEEGPVVQNTNPIRHKTGEDQPDDDPDADDDDPDDSNESGTDGAVQTTEETDDKTEDDGTDTTDSDGTDGTSEDTSDGSEAVTNSVETTGEVSTDSTSTDISSFQNISGVDVGFIITHGERNHSSLSHFRQDLIARGAEIDFIESTLNLTVLEQYDLLVIDENFDLTRWDTAEKDALRQWIENGGSLLVHAETHPPAVEEITSDLGIEYRNTYDGSRSNTSLIASHPITRDVEKVHVPAANGDSLNVTSPAEVLVWDSRGVPVIAISEGGAGRVAVLSQDFVWNNPSFPYYTTADTRVLSQKIISWLVASGDWKQVISDPNEGDVTVDIENVSTQADGDNRYFKFHFYDGWNDSQSDGLNAAIYIDVDQSDSTGANVSNYFQGLDTQSSWNHLGADYAIRVGADGNGLWKWNDTATSWNKSYASLAFLDLQNGSDRFEVGVSRALIENPRTFAIQTSNHDFNNSGEIDWARDQGAGVVVVNFTHHARTSNESFPTVRTYLTVNTTAGLNGNLTAANFSVTEDGVDQSIRSVDFIATNSTWVVEYNTSVLSRDGTVRVVSVIVDDPNGVDSTDGQYVAPTLEDALNVTDVNATAYPSVAVNLSVNTTAGRAGNLSTSNFTVTEDGVEQSVRSVTFQNASESWILAYNTTDPTEDGTVRNVSVRVDDPAGIDTDEGQYIATGSVVISSIDPTEFPTVRAFLNVLTPAGRSGNLTADDFSVQEAGVNQSTRSVNFTGNATNTTVDILVVFDRTGSMGDEIADMRDGVRNMSRQLAASGRDVRFALVSFSDSDSTLHPSGENWAYRQNFTRNVTEFERELDSLSTGGGTENNYDAISGGLELSFRPSAQKVVIDITDEDNDFHEVTQSEIANDLETLGATYIAVTPDNEKRVLAEEVDGQWYDITTVEFTDVLSNITTTLSATWIVEYNTTNTVEDGTVRNVSVTVEEPILRSDNSVEGRYIADTLKDDMRVERVENDTFPAVKAYLTINTSAGQNGTLDKSNFQVRENGVNQSIQSVNFTSANSTWILEYNTTRPDEDGGVRTLAVKLNESAGVGTVVESYAAPWACRSHQIDQPGFYELNRSITSARNDSCIRINASDVVFDGRGFTINQTGGGEAVNITAMGSVSNVTIHDLSVEGGASGITLHAPADGASVTNVTVVNSRLNGSATGLHVRADGYASTVDIGIFGNRLTNVSNGLHVDASGDDGAVSLWVAENRIDATGWGIDNIYANGQNKTAGIFIVNNSITTGSYEAIQDVWVDGSNQTVDVVVADNTIDAATYGLEDIEAAGADSAVSVTVLNNTIDSGNDAIQDIHASRSDQTVDVLIAENEFNAGGDGIEDIDVDGLRSEVAVTVLDNEISSSFEAIEDIDADRSNQRIDVVIAGNHLVAGSEGIENVMTSGSGTRANVSIVNNVIQVGSFDEGIMDIHAYGSDSVHDIVIADNEIIGGQGIEDIEVDGTDSTIRLVIADNEIRAGSDGISGIDIDGSNQTVEAFIFNNLITGFSTYGINFDDVQLLDAHHFDVQVVENHLRSSPSSSVGIRIDPDAGTGPPSGVLNVGLNNITTGETAVEVAIGPPDGIEVHHNVLDAGVYGVENHNTTAGTYVNATDNYWNASDGPGSVDAYEDPVTGAPANGSGSNVTNATATVANVHFDPFLSAPPDLRGDSLADALTVTDVDAGSFPTIRVTLRVNTSAGRNGTLTESNFSVTEDGWPQTIESLTFDANNGTWIIEYHTTKTIADGTVRRVAITVNESAGVGTVEETYVAPDTDKQTEVSLKPSSRIVSIGETTTFDIVVENATGGVGAHSTSVSLGNATVANITGVDLHGNPGHEAVTFATDNSSVTIDAEQMDTNDTGAVAIASVTIVGEANGTTDVLLSSAALEDESGVEFTITGTNNATLRSSGGEANLTVTPDSKDYGGLVFGTTETATFTVTNGGRAPLDINETSIAGSGATAFSIVSSVPSRLDPGESASLSVAFNATPPDGLRTAVLVIEPENANLSSAEIALSGRVDAPEVGPSTDALAFHSVAVDDTETRRFAITNDGALPLTVEDVRLEGTNAGAFDITLDGAATLDPDQGLDVIVSFTPTSTGEKTARVVIESDDPVNPVVNVSLSGQGRTADINATPESVGFGTVPRGDLRTANVTVTNDGFATLDVTDASISGPNADAFTVVSGTTGSVVPGATHTITLAFEPGSAGPKSAKLSIASNDPDEDPLNVTLTGTGTVPDISVTPASRDFGEVPSDSSASQTVTVTNDGDATLVAELPQITGDDADAFAVVSPGGTMRIAPGESRQVTVSFAPAATGDQRAVLTLASNDPDEPSVDVTLAGTGTESDIALDPSTLAFEEVRVGETEFQTFTIENQGGDALTVTGLDLIGQDTGAFAITSGEVTTNVTLQPGESHAVTVGFSPTATGDGSAAVSVTSDDPENPQVNVSVGGTGVLPDINVSTAAVEFDHTRVAGSQERIITVSNDGNANLTVTGTDIVGSESGEFTVVRGGDSFTLRPGEERNVTIAFTPASGGVQSANLSIASNDPDEDPLNVTLAGRAVTPDVTVSPEALLYGDVTINTEKTLNVTLSNDPNATADLPVDRVVVIGPDASAFDASTDSFNLGPGESRNITVTFNPQTGGDNKTATLRILTDDPSVPQLDVWLTNSRTIVDVDRIDPPAPGEQGVSVNVTNATANEPVSANVSQPESREGDAGVDEITVNTTEDADFTANVTTDDDSRQNFTRTNVSTPIKFIRVNQSIDDSKLANVSFVVRVSKVRLDQLNATPEDFIVYRFHNGTWNELNVTLIGETRTHFLYLVESPGFSEFASGAKKPDFDIAQATVSVDAVRIGESVRIITRITNAEDAADGTFTVKLLLDGSVVATRDVTIAAGGTRQVTFDRSFSEAGTFTVEVNDALAGRVSVEAADEDGTAGGGSAGGGGGSGPSGSPSFALQDVSLTATAIEVGETVEVSGRITNTGDAAGTFEATFQVNHVPLVTRQVRIPANESATVSFSRTFEQAGTFQVGINDMVAGTVTVEEPAAATRTAEPGEPTARLVVESASTAATTIEAGETVEVQATIVNEGNASAEHTATFEVNGVIVAERRVTIPPGESVQVTFSRTFEEAGTYELQVDDQPAGTLTVEATPTPATGQSPTTAGSPSSPTPGEGGIIQELPGFGHGVALVALLAFVLLIARRRERV